jgi:hypothetical protein
MLQFECGRGFVMSQVEGIGFAVGPPAPARLTMGLAKAKIENRLKMKIVRNIVPLHILLGGVSSRVLVIARGNTGSFPGVSQSCRAYYR